MPPRATTRFPNSTIAWKSFAGKGVEPQRGQLSQPSPEPVSRTNAPEATTSPEHRRPRAGRSGGTRRARRARGARAGRLTRARPPTLPRRDPTAWSGSPAAANVASTTARLSAGKRDEEPARRLRVVGERLQLRGTRWRRRAGRRTRGCGGRRRCGPRPRRAPARRAARAAPPASRTMRTPERDAVSWACPSSPNPVTSVTAFGVKGRSASAASRFDSHIASIAASSAPAGATPSRTPWRTSPVPSGFVRKTTSPGLAPCSSARSRPGAPSRRPRARTSARRRGSCGPPARIAPASRTASAAPARISPSISTGSSSGKAVTESASSGRPPIAKTSLSAFVAAIRPKARGSSTTGGKKSTVKTSAVGRRAGRRPRRRPGRDRRGGLPPRPGTRPSSSCSSRAAEYFAAHPPAFARLVRPSVAAHPLRVYGRPPGGL